MTGGTDWLEHRGQMNQHWLNADERAALTEDGYLVVPDVLTDAQCTHLERAIDELTQGVPGPFNEADILALDPAFVDLIDNPVVLPKIAAILGWNIWVNHSHYNVAPGSDEPTENPEASCYYGWLRDGGALHRDVPSVTTPLSMKVGFFLTDLREKGSGQPLILEGSHRDRSRWLPEPLEPPPSHTRALSIRRGSALLIDARTAHASYSPVLCGGRRRAVFVQWAYRWLCPVDPMTVEALRVSTVDPLRQQLLGLSAIAGRVRDRKRFPRAGQKRSGRYYPIEEEVPLRTLMQHFGQDVTGRVWRGDHESGPR